jgi:hypothetical protein
MTDERSDGELRTILAARRSGGAKRPGSNLSGLRGGSNLSHYQNDDSFFSEFDDDTGTVIIGTSERIKERPNSEKERRPFLEQIRVAELATAVTRNQTHAEPVKPRSSWVNYRAGLDVSAGGKDKTALAIIEVTDYNAYDQPFMTLSFLKRFEKFLGFGDIAEKIKVVVNATKADPLGRKVDLLFGIDSRGVGAGLAEDLQQRVLVNENVMKVVTTGGEYGARGVEDGSLHADKNYLYGLVHAAVNSERLTIPKLKTRRLIEQELLDFGAKVSEHGTTQLGAVGSSNDDLVTALAISVLLATKYSPIHFW